jgi:ACS family tartrate transporter-like MFS transporter
MRDGGKTTDTSEEWIDDMELDIEKTAIRKITLRLVPFLTICYFFALLDRFNVGVAALQMNKDIGLSNSAFGFGSSLFFVAYYLFEIPSNIVLQKVGARIWIARIMVTWGLAAASCALIRGPISYGVARFVLGAAEAGFFPGVILYLTFWVPSAYRARMIAWFMVAIPAAGFFGSQMSGWLLSLNGLHGLRGWHWLFLAEGLPSVLLGFICLVVLQDRPEAAIWLSAEEKAWLTVSLERERHVARQVGEITMWQLARNKYVWGLILPCAAALAAGSVLGVWQPQLIKAYGFSDLQTGLLNSIPYGVAAGLMIVWGRSSDVTRERRWHTAIPLLMIAVGFATPALASGLPATLVLMSCVLVGAFSFKAPFWAMALEFLSPRVIAVAVAGINAIGTLIGGLMINLYGAILDQTGSTNLAMLPTAAMGFVSAVVVLAMTGLRQSPVKAEAKAPSKMSNFNDRDAFETLGSKESEVTN